MIQEDVTTKIAIQGELGDSDTSRGCASVEFKTLEDLRQALWYSGRKIGDSVMRVFVASEEVTMRVYEGRALHVPTDGTHYIPCEECCNPYWPQRAGEGAKLKRSGLEFYSLSKLLLRRLARMICLPVPMSYPSGKCEAFVLRRRTFGDDWEAKMKVSYSHLNGT